MAKENKKLKKYTAVATIFYSREATAGYTIMAENDKQAVKIMRDIVEGRGISTESDYFEDVDKWFNVNGSFLIAQGDEVPDDDEDEAVIGGRQSFENDR